MYTTSNNQRFSGPIIYTDSKYLLTEITTIVLFLLYVGFVLLDELAEFNLEVVKHVSISQTLLAMITYSAVQSSKRILFSML